MTSGTVRVKDNRFKRQKNRQYAISMPYFPEPMGFIYVIGHKNVTKVGITENIPSRMKQLSPDIIYAIFVSPNFKFLEKRAHQLFSEKRIPKTEWFLLDDNERKCLIMWLEKNSDIVSEEKVMEDYLGIEEIIYSQIEWKLKEIKNGMIDLHEEAINITYSELKNILSLKTNVNLKDEEGTLPIHYAAAKNNDPLVIEEFIKAGSDITVKDNKGMLPIHYSALLNTNPEVTKKLIRRTSDIRVVDNNGRTPLHHAAAHNPNSEVVLSLIDGFTISAKDNFGRTPLDYAYKHNTYKIFELVKSWKNLREWWERY